MVQEYVDLSTGRQTERSHPDRHAARAHGRNRVCSVSIGRLDGSQLAGQRSGPRGMVVPPPLAQSSNANQAGEFLGMSIAEAAKKFLANRKQAMGNGDIAAGLTAGGLVMSENTDHQNIVGSVLTRRFDKVGDVVRVSRGMWGLKEWYPNRSFKSNAKTGDDAPRNGTSEPEPPSEPPQSVAAPRHRCGVFALFLRRWLAVAHFACGDVDHTFRPLVQVARALGGFRHILCRSLFRLAIVVNYPGPNLWPLPLF